MSSARARTALLPPSRQTRPSGPVRPGAHRASVVCAGPAASPSGGRACGPGAMAARCVVACLILSTGGRQSPGNPLPWPPPASMPLEEMRVGIQPTANGLHASFSGDFLFTYIPPTVTSMLFPLPPNATNIAVRQDGAPVPWTWSTERYPTVVPEYPSIPMIRWEGPFPAQGCVFSVDYEHDLIQRPGEFIFVYANGTGKYFETYEKNTTAWFDIRYPVCYAVNGVRWDDIPYAYQVDGYHLLLTTQSWFGPIVHDVIVSLAGDPASCDPEGNGRPDWEDASPLVGFATPTAFDLPAQADRLLLADVNNDAKADLVTTSLGVNQVSVRLQTGGVFGPPVDYPIGLSAGGITAGDFNGDGRQDLAIADISTPSVAVLVNQGNGTFAPQVHGATGSGCGSIRAADLDGDDDLDLVLLAGAGGSGSAACVRLNSGGAFAAPATYPLPAYGRALACVDVDGDDDVDLVAVAGNLDSSVVVLFNDGHGNLGPPVTVLAGQHCNLLAVGDFDGDGDQDLAVNGNDNTVWILNNNGTGGFAIAAGYGVRPNPGALVAVDLDNDGDVDLVAAGDDYYPPGDMSPDQGALTLLINRGDGTFRPGHDLLLPDTCWLIGLTAAHVDGDPLVDLVSIHQSVPAGIQVYLNRTLPASAAADFDHDRDVDFVDMGHFLACRTGPAVASAAPDCVNADLDGDDDVDQVDFGLVQRCLSGSNSPADPNCVD